MFQISIRSFLKVKVYIYHHLRIQPSEVEKLPYYEYEYLVEDLKQMLEDRRREEAGQSGDASVSKAMADAKRAMPSAPKMPSPKFPSVPSNLSGVLRR